jgi:hypothetical protein
VGIGTVTVTAMGRTVATGMIIGLAGRRSEGTH